MVNVKVRGKQISFARFKSHVPRTEVVTTKKLGRGTLSKLVSGTQDRGFDPGRSRRIFRTKKFTACLPSEGK
jgi:hypothetical protein